jgi:hypothetical protein
MAIGDHVLQNTRWQFGVLVLLNTCWQLGNTLLPNRNDRVSSFNWTRGSKLYFLTRFSILVATFLV